MATGRSRNALIQPKRNPQRGEAAVQVDVGPTRFGKHCTEFGVAERAEQNDNATRIQAVKTRATEPTARAMSWLREKFLSRWCRR